jgi:uncharacterized protein
VKAASVDRRIKAVGTASAVNVGAATRKGWEGKGSGADLLATLEALAKQRTAEAVGGEPPYVPYVPQLGDTSAPRDMQEAAEYYLKPALPFGHAALHVLYSALRSFLQSRGQRAPSAVLLITSATTIATATRIRPPDYGRIG